MTVSSIEVTEGSGKHIHTSSRSISGVTRQDQYVQQGESEYATYSVIASDISVATTADHVLQVMGDGTNYCRLRSVTIRQSTLAGSAGTLGIQLLRISTAGTGGTTVTPRGLDAADTYAGAAMTLPTAKGTEGNVLQQWRLPVVAAQPMIYECGWEHRLGAKPIIFGTSTANGIAFKVVAGIASCKADIVAVFIVTSYL